MAIISIPSSIGGVSVPGNLLKGPLAKLFGSNSQIASYSYPRDLGSATRGHWIQFLINEIQPTQYDTSNITSLVKDGASSVKNTDFSLESATAAAKKLGNTAIDVGKEVGNTVVKAYEDSNYKLSPRKERISATVALYMPDGITFTNQASYGETTLLKATQDILNAAKSIPLVGTVASAASAGIDIVQSDAAKLALSTQGLAINPGQQMLFDGIDFRTYSLSFTFTPYSREEAQTVKEIIKLFKTHAAPRISDSGMFFIPPSTFNLEFYYNGGVNTNIGKVAESVIESIEVNYAPNGWSAHTDGAPVQTTMTISFKEIELIDRAKIENDGY
jgi:hypothetical protein